MQKVGEKRRAFVMSPPHVFALVVLRVSSNKTGSKVEAHVASCPLLSLFRREEPIDGDTGLPYTLRSYRSTAAPYINTGIYFISSGQVGIDNMPSQNGPQQGLTMPLVGKSQYTFLILANYQISNYHIKSS